MIRIKLIMNMVITIPLSWDLQLLYGILPCGAGDVKDCFGKEMTLEFFIIPQFFTNLNVDLFIIEADSGTKSHFLAYFLSFSPENNNKTLILFVKLHPEPQKANCWLNLKCLLQAEGAETVRKLCGTFLSHCRLSLTNCKFTGHRF